MKKIITAICLLICLIYSFTSYAQTSPNEIIQGPFKTNLFPDGAIYFEKSSDINKPINFVLEYQQNGKTIKNIVDKYDVNGDNPEIVSVFFNKIHNKKYIFTIIKWRNYHQTLQINGYDFQIYAYTINKLGKLTLDKRIANDSNLSGTDGEYYGKEVFLNTKQQQRLKNILNINIIKYVLKF